MIFLLLFGIFAGIYQLWLFGVGIRMSGRGSKVTVGIIPGLASVLLIGAWFLLT